VIRGSAIVVVAACASALNEPSPISAFAPGHAEGRTIDELVRDGDAAWVRRDEPGQAAAAQALYLDAAAADDHGVVALLRAMRAMSFRIEREHRSDLVSEQVQLGQWCRRHAPTNGECDYRLAIALGQQARERSSTAKDAIGKMVDLLHHAIVTVPRIDNAGPHRVLALVLLHAPAWPLGPGDLDAAVDEARAAVAMFPDAPDNQRVLAEALAARAETSR